MRRLAVEITEAESPSTWDLDMIQQKPWKIVVSGNIVMLSSDFDSASGSVGKSTEATALYESPSSTPSSGGLS